MRALVGLLVFVMLPTLASAEVHWHRFDVSLTTTQSIKVGSVSLTVRRREVRNADFEEDHLLIVMRRPGKPEMEEWFDSSYGMGAVAIQDGVLLVKYGRGRGTAAREEFVRIIHLEQLVEVADVKVSYYVNAEHSKTYSPDLVEYRVESRAKDGYTSISFLAPKRLRGLPSEKVMTFKQ
jgi:hypothetical protein